MKTGVKKALSGKSMRVATTFTGVAACTVAFAPTANASSLRNRSCSRGTSNWLHIALSRGDTCWGFKGYDNTESPFSRYCGGTNYGWFKWNSPYGTHATVHFGPGKTYAYVGGSPYYPLIMSEVRINSWSGNDKCPPP